MSPVSCVVTLQLIPDELVRCFKRKMLNIHPGLLPSFGGKGYYGERVHQAVLASGARCVPVKEKGVGIRVTAGPNRCAMQHCCGLTRMPSNRSRPLV
jgi:hypothetical protein